MPRVAWEGGHIRVYIKANHWLCIPTLELPSVKQIPRLHKPQFVNPGTKLDWGNVR